MEKIGIIYLDISDLKEAEYNPRQLTEHQYSQIKKSLEEFGFVDPVIVNQHPDRLNTIIGGHMRVKVWKALGNSTAPCVFVSLSLEKEKELNIRLNKNTGEWDFDKLANEFNELDLIDWGFMESELKGWVEKVEAEETTGDDDIPEKVPTVSVNGDLYELGQHKLLCGDSTMIDDIERLMNGEKADMVFTDPPYGISVVNGNGKTGSMVGYSKDRKVKTGTYKQIIGDDVPFEPSLLLTLADKQIIWGANHFASKLPDSSRWIVWDKKGDLHLDNSFSDVELAWTNFEGKAVKKFMHLWSGLQRQGNRDDELKSRVHPTQKPVGLFVDILDKFADTDWSILDPYIGSGSTLIACEKTNRKCYGLEIDPQYCDVIVNRYITFCKKNNKEYTVKRNGEVCDDFEEVTA